MDKRMTASVGMMTQISTVLGTICAFNEKAHGKPWPQDEI